MTQDKKHLAFVSFLICQFVDCVTPGKKTSKSFCGKGSI